VQFCVCEAKISASAENGQLTLHADPQDPDSRILYFDFRETRPAPYPAASALAKIEELTAEEIESGTFTRPIPEDAGFFKVYFVNRYGVWTHRMRPLPDAE